jgi:hypothetical protein
MRVDKLIPPQMLKRLHRHTQGRFVVNVHYLTFNLPRPNSNQSYSITGPVNLLGSTEKRWKLYFHRLIIHPFSGNLLKFCHFRWKYTQLR